MFSENLCFWRAADISYAMDRMDYRQILRDQYQVRRGRNSGYSLRAYARDLGLSAPRLNEVLSGKKGLSLEAATKIAKLMKLDSSEEIIFILSVDALHNRSIIARKAAAEKLRAETERLEPEIPKHTTIVHWSTEAAQKLGQRDGFLLSAENLSIALGIPLYLASGPIRFLTRAGLIPGVSKDRAYIAGRLKGKRLNVDYEQILELARKAFLTNPSASVDRFDHEPLLLEPEDIDKAQKIISEAYRDLRKLESNSKSARLFYFASQFFKVENERKKK